MQRNNCCFETLYWMMMSSNSRKLIKDVNEGYCMILKKNKSISGLTPKSEFAF